MPQIFVALDKIKPAYDITYRVVLVLCKILLVADILITSMAVAGRYIPFIPDPSWSEEVVLTLMSYMAGHPPGEPHPHDRSGWLSAQGPAEVS